MWRRGDKYECMASMYQDETRVAHRRGTVIELLRTVGGGSVAGTEPCDSGANSGSGRFCLSI